MASSWYSFSRVTMFEQCAKRYDFRYNKGMKEPFDSIEGYVGKRCHDAVQWLYTEKQAGRAHTLDEIVKIYREGWKHAPENLKITRRGDSRESYQAVGEAMLRKFFPKIEADTLNTIGIEHKLFFKIAEKHDFIGYIDRLAREPGDGGRVWVIDYKTGKTVPFGFSGKEADQLRTYACGVMRKYTVDEVHLRLEYMRTGEAHEGSLKRSEMEAFEAGLAERIEATRCKTYPANPGVLCGWCGFKDICEEAQKR